MYSLLAPAKELLAREEELNHKSGDYNLGMANRIVMVLCLLAVCGAAAGLVAGIGIARSVSRCRNCRTSNDEPMGILGQGFEHARGWHCRAAHAK